MNKIEPESGPKPENLVRAKPKQLNHDPNDYGYEYKGEEVVDEVLVAKFYVLEVDGGGEVRHCWR